MTVAKEESGRGQGRCKERPKAARKAGKVVGVLIHTRWQEGVAQSKRVELKGHPCNKCPEGGFLTGSLGHLLHHPALLRLIIPTALLGNVGHAPVPLVEHSL